MAISLLIAKKISCYRNKKANAMFAFSLPFGWGTWIRTKELSGSEPDALPLGYTP